ncbi:hypothetical protein Taro_054560 [Colocasia esculenta]|uniref:Uncharacterized protein n=1 Tax=Colocasia esculenta TaxID=4460 RepID=A0A843XRK1_COLES|nr:hypothetical protein [Colocasia esculenta]
MFSEQMASGSGSHSGSRPRRQRITLQQNASTVSNPLSSAVASTVGSTSSIAGLVSSQAWGRGHGCWGPSRCVTNRRLETGQRWNVHVVGGIEVGDSGAQFNIADHNKTNWSHQSMPYRKGKKSHYQLKDDFERMIQLPAPSLDSESGSTPISAEEAFVSVMGKD